jgi:predicted metal-dependent phosphoesterase TrpH
MKSVHDMVQAAAQRKLLAVAVTDHDALAGLAEIDEAAKRWQIEVVPGIEISSTCSGFETHILGYYIDRHHAILKQFTQEFRTHRKDRAREILRKLTHQGIDIPFDLVQSKAGHGVIGRPHIADLMVEEGFVFSFQEAFNKYLAEHRPAFVPKTFIDAEGAIDLIHSSGGLAFLAHPGVGVADEVIQRLALHGLDGIETLHPKHHAGQVLYYQEMARKLNMLETGGSDCHGARYGELMLGCMMVPYRLLENMKEKLSTRANVLEPVKIDNE